MSLAIEQLLADAGQAAHEPRRAFDVAAGLRRLARDAGYTAAPPDPFIPPLAHAHHQLVVVSRWCLTHSGAAVHIERLAAELGEDASSEVRAPLKDLDVDGAQVFACMLYLADHPESALFWWQLAAGAGHGVAAYCLYLRHLGLGEAREAKHWLQQLQRPSDGPDDEFMTGLDRFTLYIRRHGSPNPVSTGGIEAEIERLADTSDTGGLVCRPDQQLADRLHELAGQH
ncbi:hypothetical protein ABT126_42190 [Streptomyces sp. NPDC002012]|uniref:hypothetical protein n=1 Tax=Streptomyces sp. NPDC002012 TaxID=3154532 RepID=UPI00332FF875